MSDVVQHVRRTLALTDRAGLTDGQLLECFIEHRDAAAFAALVRRHGPMVWGVCRRVLSKYHDAEDAFQATFLVLVRKAAAIMPREMVSNWLYGVAHQTALKARAITAKRRTRERQVMQMPEPAVADQDLWNDLQPLLDQELSRLPDKYRVAIVLCDLEGKTRKEGARQLGCPEGTLAAQLARGRVMLAKRLARRGLALAGGAVAGLLAQNAAVAGVPYSVVATTVKAASVVAAGQWATGLISVKVAALTDGVVKAMLLTKLKQVAMALFLFLGICLGAAEFAYLASAPMQSESVGQKQLEPAGGTTKAKAGKKKGNLDVIV
ncbi:MAG: sigma-70 family RNA polymerase sigma factor [Planctomycetes bacterium]|nr:sigma-70 family RNA polymerase sigma factor [Planctomycetota bacterium]